MRRPLRARQAAQQLQGMPRARNVWGGRLTREEEDDGEQHQKKKRKKALPDEDSPPERERLTRTTADRKWRVEPRRCSTEAMAPPRSHPTTPSGQPTALSAPQKQTPLTPSRRSRASSRKDSRRCARRSRRRRNTAPTRFPHLHAPAAPVLHTPTSARTAECGVLSWGDGRLGKLGHGDGDEAQPYDIVRRDVTEPRVVKYCEGPGAVLLVL